jgi:Protein of unknown function (DUF992)
MARAKTASPPCGRFSYHSPGYRRCRRPSGGVAVGVGKHRPDDCATGRHADVEPDPGHRAGAGASGEVSIAAGLGANVLVGGSSSTVALQPVSVQGQVGPRSKRFRLLAGSR